MKQERIDYRRELELVTRADNITEEINNTIGELPFGHIRHFLSGVERAVKKESRHWLRMSKYKGISPVYDDIRKILPRMHFERGKLVSIKDLAESLYHTPQSTLNALERLKTLEGVFDFCLVSDLVSECDHRHPTNTYLLIPVSEDSYQGRIPVNGKPKIDSKGAYNRNLIKRGVISEYSATKLGIEIFGRSNGGFRPEIIKECLRQLSAEVKERGYCWKNKPRNPPQGYCEHYEYITSEEADNIFNLFLERTRLPVGTIDDKPVLAYHPRLIRRYRKK